MEDLEQRLLLASDFQNPGNPFDVDGNFSTPFEVVPLDANIIITELNNRTISTPIDGILPELGLNDPGPENYIDVSGDGILAPFDALLVINQLNLDFSSGSTDSFVPTSQLGTTPEGGDTMVNPTSTNFANNPAADTRAGNTVVVWEQFNSTNNVWEILGQRYDSAGTQVGDEFVVSGQPDFSQRFPAVAVNGQGAFAVAWQSVTAAGDLDVFTRTYDADGNVQSGAILVNETTAGNQQNPVIAAVENDRFAVVWQGNGVGDNSGIFQREVLLTGTVSGSESRVNLDIAGRQSQPSVAALSDGTTVVAWDGSGVVNGQVSDGIFARVGNGDQLAFIGADDVSDPTVSVGDDDAWALAWLDGDQFSVQPIPADSLITTGPELTLEFSGLEPLGASHNYEAWVIVDGEPISAGIFDITLGLDGSSNAINSDGSPAQFFGRTGASDIVISIEPQNDLDPGPAETKVLGGDIQLDGSFTLSIDHPLAINTDFSTAAGEFILATPTTTTTTDEFSGVWFVDLDSGAPEAGLDLPDLPAGWTYEGWAIIDGVPVSTGRFDDPALPDDFSGFSGTDAPAPPFPGEDFVQNAPVGLNFPTDLRDSAAANPIVISVEPVPDNSTAPFALRPLVGPIPSNAAAETNLPLTAGDVAISGSGSLVTRPALNLNFSGLEPLGSEANYEAWVIVGGEPVTAGVFDIDGSGNAVNSDGSAATLVSALGATSVVISIEPENDPDPGPAATRILGGDIQADGSVTLSIDHPSAFNTDFSTAAGEFILATPTTSIATDEFSGVWFIDLDSGSPEAGLDLPDLPAGWAYEGWAIIDGVPVTTGTFVDPTLPDNFSGFSGTDAPAPPFPGEDFIQNAPDGVTFPTDLRTSAAANPIVISIEPVPDNSPAPFALRPLVGPIPANAEAETNLPLNSGTVAISGSGGVVLGPQLSLDFSGLEPLGDTANYEAWVIVDGAPVTAGIFDIDANGTAINVGGSAATFSGQPGATSVVISIEPEIDTNPDPAATRVLGGDILADGSVTLSIDHPTAFNTDFSTAAGEFILATPTTTTTTDEFSGVWFIDLDSGSPEAGLDLPDLPLGWAYEGWAIIDGVPVTTGQFRDPTLPDDFSGFSGTDAPAPPFPGEDFIQNAPAGVTFPTDLRTSAAATPIVVSIEPVPDNSPDPFALRPLVGAIPSNAAAETNLPLTAGTVAISGSGRSIDLLDIEAGRSTSNPGVESGIALDHLEGGGFVTAFTTNSSADVPGAVATVEFDALGNGVSSTTMENNSTLISFDSPVVAGGNGSYLTLWRGYGASDARGIFGRLTSVATTAPLSIIEIDDVTISEGTSEFTETITAVALNATGPVTFSLASDVPGATINPTSGVISIPITEASGPSLNEITVIATSGGETAQESFMFTVSEFNIPPNIGFIANPTVAAGSPLNFTAPGASDVDIPQNILTYVATQTNGAALPAWLDFDPGTRLFTGTPAPTDSSVDVTITVTDPGGLQDTSSFTINVLIPTNTAPSFAGVAVLDRLVVQNSALVPFIVPPASDADVPAQVLTYSATQSNGSALPDWLNFNTTTREFSGTPTPSDVGMVDVTVTVTDSGGLSANTGFTITVIGQNTAPSFADDAFTDQFVVQNTTESFTVPEASDVDVPSQNLAYTATQTDGTSLPGWLTFNPATRTFTASPTAADLGDLDVRVVATDPGGLTAVLEFDVRVRENDDPFFITPTGTIFVGGGLQNGFLLNLGITDNDGVADSPTFALTASDFQGAAVTPDGQFTLPVDIPNGSYDFTVTATENGFTDDEEFTIEVDL